ncbi:MAG: hypothetical protein WKI04_14780 [Ferruginibacter sp.]
MILQSYCLPRKVVETVEIEWAWEDISDAGFHQLVNNFCNYCQENAGTDTRATSLFATLHLWNKSTGRIQLKAVLIDAQQADKLIGRLLHAVNKELDFSYRVERKKLGWLEFALNPFPDIFSGEKGSFKVKDAFLLEPYTPDQVRVLHHYLTMASTVPGGFIGLATYGGQVNTVAPGATASFQRTAILTTACVAGWINPDQEKQHMEWVRNCYKDLFAQTGGVPVPGKQSGGCLIAHPDKDLADAGSNTSGIAWHWLYYQDNYQRLQWLKQMGPA